MNGNAPSLTLAMSACTPAGSLTEEGEAARRKQKKPSGFDVLDWSAGRWGERTSALVHHVALPSVLQRGLRRSVKWNTPAVRPRSLSVRKHSRLIIRPHWLRYQADSDSPAHFRVASKSFQSLW